ncbi:hypothetical protein NQ317_012247 [Molorchus minor]|uniref:Uncharacterized protein n=1 Tax=Molorchus minor TaxID=1323400 RepID=A0ABQ9K365_9CUCU|nr:hypothetical protein NQ317_012247 [Molorchus minor]
MTKNLVIPIFNRNAQVEERLLNIHIENINDTVQMKLRDPSEYSFNYTENIDLGDFEVMRVANDRLQKQLSNARNVISEKEQQIELLTVTKNKMKKEFKNNFKQVNDLVSGKIIETQKLLQGKILNFKQRIDRSLEQVRIVKRDLGIQNESNAQLLKKIEDLRKESEINAELLGRLKTGNNELLNEKLYQEKHYLELKKILQEKESAFDGNELKSDVEKAAIAITQKKGDHR